MHEALSGIALASDFFGPDYPALWNASQSTLLLHVGDFTVPYCIRESAHAPRHLTGAGLQKVRLSSTGQLGVLLSGSFR